MIQSIVLRVGNQNTLTTSFLLFQSCVEFQASKEAFHSLTYYLWDKFKLDNGIYDYSQEDNDGSCCHLFSAEGTCNFCPNCGEKLKNHFMFDLDSWKFFLKNLFHSNMISYGNHMKVKNPHQWSPWNLDFQSLTEKVLVIGNDVEWFLTISLKELYPQFLIDQNQIDLCNLNIISTEYEKIFQ